MRTAEALAIWRVWESNVSYRIDRTRPPRYALLARIRACHKRARSSNARALLESLHCLVSRNQWLGAT